ncbi:MAG TPA: amylo-alpha-1,6-glucosidase [Vitreimonas sp.]|nr:amylo-alpha-1,6-glucosidase [Vitreimonas sp.]
MTPVPTTPTLVDFRGDVLRDLDAGVRPEWLVTNGLGGYASGTASGVPTRAYHGYLIAAVNPPVDRTVFGSGLRERVGGEALHVLERPDGSLDGDGHTRLERLRLDGMLPTWTYALGEGRHVERRVWMEHEASTTYVRYELVEGEPAVLDIEPLATARDHQEVDRPPASPRVERLPDGLRFQFEGRPPVAIRCRGAAVDDSGRWEQPFALREQAARSEGDATTSFAVGRLQVELVAGRAVTLVLSTEDIGAEGALDGEAALARVTARQEDLIAGAGASNASSFVRQLVIAADQFLVGRRIPAGRGRPPEPGRTVIAGYHWFNDWGRDTMIALAGLTLATGRPAEGAAILRSFARFVRDGLLPNNFPDHEDQEVGYHTIDAALWYPVAIERQRVATGDERLVEDLLPVVRQILDRHISGTRFGIGMDPDDGLVRGAAEGYQLTWMDAKVEDWVVTPRRGKPVEIQALWINSLRMVAGWLRTRGEDVEAKRYEEIAVRATESFLARFWRPELGFLADVVDGPDGDELKLRPNQLFAISLPHPLVDEAAARSVVTTVERELLTPGGLRSLAPSDPDYRPKFHGNRWFRDAAYHQGTVWAWLIGPYVDALVRLGDREAALEALRPFEAHLSDGGLGTISENFEPTRPFEPRGCIAQAWSVAEVLRCRRALAGE